MFPGEKQSFNEYGLPPEIELYTSEKYACFLKEDMSFGVVQGFLSRLLSQPEHI